MRNGSARGSSTPISKRNETMVLRFVTFATACLLCAATSVFAHARLTISDPAEGATLRASPPAISLTFSEGLEPAFGHVTLAAASGEPVDLDREKVGGDGSTILSASIPKSLVPGRYVVKWNVLSTDGHKTSGTSKFTVAP
ncbi:copper resistance protein CopC [Rhizobium ruizarguesonis]|nr:copper resistance protein CopC [Rhizobium ruizarguesonis]